MQLWGDASIDLDKDIKLLLFIWYTYLFDAHHAAAVHCSSGPKRTCWKNPTFVCSGGTTKIEGTPVNKNRVCLFPCLFTSAVLHFKKQWAGCGVEALLNTVGLFQQLQVSNLLFILKIWGEKTRILWFWVWEWISGCAGWCVFHARAFMHQHRTN